jgi:(S)-citramalyl-CoA lyase
MPERFGNAAKSGSDALIVDIEDAVPLNLKAEARSNVRKLLEPRPLEEMRSLLGVRTNQLDSRAGLDDIAMLLDATSSPHYVLIPKVESPEQVTHVARLFEESRRDCGFIPMIESARGLTAVWAIAHAHPRVSGLMFGAADYAAGVRAQPDSLALQLARAQVAGACAEAGVLAIDAPCFALRDPALLRAELSFAFANGFEAKAAIHPSHIASINEVFTPSPERIAWAQKVMAAVEHGVGAVEGLMVDEAIARQARRVLAQQA